MLERVESWGELMLDPASFVSMRGEAIVVLFRPGACGGRGEDS